MIISTETHHVRQLTGLRFIAALGVVICHFSREIKIPEPALFIADFLGSFVALFFVLSGFVLTLNYHSLTHDHSRATYWRYIVARLARVIPVYWVALLLMLLVYWTQGFPDYQREASQWSLGFVLSFFALQAWVPDLFLQQSWNAPGWSISSELFFYLLLPLFLRMKWLDGSRRAFAAIWLGLLVLLAGYWLAIFQIPFADLQSKQFALVFPVRLPLFGVFCFLFGINLGRAFLQRKQHAEPVSEARWLILASALVLIVAWGCFELKKTSMLGPPCEVLVIYLVYTPYFYLVIQTLFASQGPAVSLLASRPAVFLGHSSYALYLIHWPALAWLLLYPDLNPYRAWAGFAVIGGCVLLSTLLYRQFEDPLRRGIRRLAQVNR